MSFMEMHQVRYFLAMARLLNFTRAADECNVSQPSLTRAVQKLEEELGGPLFRRERSRTHLTDLGRMMLPHLERTYEGAQAAKALAQGVGKAQVAPLTLGLSSAIASAAITDIIAEVGQNLPGFQLTMHSGTSQELIELALAGSLDLVIVEAPEDAPERFDALSLFDQAYYVMVPSAHPLSAREQVSLTDVKDETWIDCGGDGFATAKAAAERAGFTFDVRHRATDAQQLRHLIVAGLGCAYSACLGRDAQLKALQLMGVENMRQIVLASIAGRRRSNAGDAFVRASRARSWASPSAV
jgi:DNA-binding transcriptional LysR family regulator